MFGAAMEMYKYEQSHEAMVNRGSGMTGIE